MKKHILLILALACILGLYSCSSPKNSQSTNTEKSTEIATVQSKEVAKPAIYKQISQDEAKKMMNEGNVKVVDVRTPEEFMDEHIAKAINIPLDSIGSQPLTDLGNLDDVLLLYCRSGNRSKQAAEKLIKLGYTNVYEFGGIKDWRYEKEKGNN